ncbi:MAG: hypothetical protein HY040_09835 [Planctomycetes bacterium]|nr:hypothetical protein [Planctomycetota bacterium]
MALALGGGVGYLSGYYRGSEWTDSKAAALAKKEKEPAQDEKKAEEKEKEPDKTSGDEKDPRTQPKKPPRAVTRTDAKAKFVGMVVKLAWLNNAPRLQLDSEQKAILRKALEGVESLESIEEGDAHDRLNVALEALLDYRQSLAPLNLGWTLRPGPDFQRDLANPFTFEQGAAALRTVRRMLAD